MIGGIGRAGLCALCAEVESGLVHGFAVFVHGAAVVGCLFTGGFALFGNLPAMGGVVFAVLYVKIRKMSLSWVGLVYGEAARARARCWMRSIPAAGMSVGRPARRFWS